MSHPYFVEKSDRCERLKKVLKKYTSYRTYVGDLLEAHSRVGSLLNLQFFKINNFRKFFHYIRIEVIFII